MESKSRHQRKCIAPYEGLEATTLPFRPESHLDYSIFSFPNLNLFRLQAITTYPGLEQTPAELHTSTHGLQLKMDPEGKEAVKHRQTSGGKQGWKKEASKSLPLRKKIYLISLSLFIVVVLAMITSVTIFIRR